MNGSTMFLAQTALRYFPTLQDSASCHQPRKQVKQEDSISHVVHICHYFDISGSNSFYVMSGRTNIFLEFYKDWIIFYHGGHSGDSVSIRITTSNRARTTVRLIAAKADIHPSMVIRYFGSKERLFAAAVDFDLRLPDFAAMSKDERGQTLVRHLLDRWEGPDSGDELPALLRFAVTHPEVMAILHRLFKEQLAPAIAQIHPPKQAATCAALLATQALGLAFTRYVVVMPNVVSLSEKQIINLLEKHSSATLTSPRSTTHRHLPRKVEIALSDRKAGIGVPTCSRRTRSREAGEWVDQGDFTRALSPCGRVSLSWIKCMHAIKLGRSSPRIPIGSLRHCECLRA